MSLVEHMIWVDYGTVAPRYIGAFDGVPVVWLYDRTRRAAAAPGAPAPQPSAPAE
jgi:hypothetical protein